MRNLGKAKDIIQQLGFWEGNGEIQQGFYQIHNVLDEYDTFADLQRRRYGNKVTRESYLCDPR